MAIKLLDNSLRFKVFSEHDEAIDAKSEAGSAAYIKFMDTLNPSDLLLIEGKDAPTPFMVRCLTAKETAALQSKHFLYDTVNKTMNYKDGFSAYLIECFETACLGIQAADGTIEKVTVDTVGLAHAISIGSFISHMTTVGKNRKNA